MCEANKRFLVYLLPGLLFVSAAGALRAEEPDRWYLVSETELRSIESYKANNEREKANWLLQARESKRLSESLNAQLSAARETNRKLEQSFSELEQERLTLLSLKNGEIAGLKKAVSDRTLEAKNYKATAALRLVIIIVLAGAWIVFLGIKVCRKFRLIPF